MAKKSNRTAINTVTDVAADLTAHENECAIRYENIEKRLDRGEQRFNRLENMIWGLYGLMITATIAGQVI